ncbi:MAG: hypothetical protein E7638_08985 [Ruminococcaceae bacterium]|nr:hypothetical protein [Oscillospiraceae bacterium]
MKNISLQSIKWESVRSIFSIIAERDTVSRAEIAEGTGLSLVTVGKAADALLGMRGKMIAVIPQTAFPEICTMLCT